MWDTAGQERFRTITQSYYRGSNAVVLAYDVGNAESFRNITRWKLDAEHFNPGVHFILVGNKNDISDELRKVTFYEGQQWASENGETEQPITFLETSAANNYQVDNIFEQLAYSLRKIDSIENNKTNIKINGNNAIGDTHISTDSIKLMAKNSLEYFIQRSSCFSSSSNT